MLKGRSRWLALLWLIGEMGYCIGILGVAVAPACLVLSSFLRAWHSGASINYGHALWSAVLGFSGFTLLTVGSVCLRAYALKRGGTLDSW